LLSTSTARAASFFFTDPMLATLSTRLLLPHAAGELSIRIAGIEAAELMLDTSFQ
jgi:hypothetical protein